MSQCALSSAKEDRWLWWLRAGMWIIGITVAVLQAVVYREWVNGDSISYLDMSDAVTTGQWSRLINATWSPLYPALIGVARLVRPSPEWDFPSAHLVNLLSFVFAFACFEFMLRRAVEGLPDDGQDEFMPLPRWAVMSLGYALFLSTSLGMLTLMQPTPDILMSGFLFLALGLMLRIRSGQDDWRTYGALGVAIGFGYLAKAIMLPLGIVMLTMTLAFGRLRQRLPRLALAVTVVVVVAGPYIAGVSKLTHHLTFGDAGRVVRLSWVDEAGPIPYWSEPGRATGHALNAPRKIFDAPSAYAKNASVNVTRIFWYDPALSAAGLEPGFHPRRQARVLLENASIYLDVLSRSGGLFALLLILAFSAGTKRSLRALVRFWPLWLTGIAALGAYALLHVEERYIGAFLTVSWLGILVGFQTPRRMPTGVLYGVVLSVVIGLAVVTGQLMRRDFADNESKTRMNDLGAARALNQMGIVPGTPVARINPRVADGWARLARVHIIAEVPRSEADMFWKSPLDTQQRLLRALSDAGARAVIAFSFGRREHLPEGWKQLGSTDYSVAMLSGTSSVLTENVVPNR